MRRKWLIPLILLLVLLSVYLWPVPRPAFEELYAAVPAEQAASLRSFRAAYPPATLPVSGAPWEYLSVGSGTETVLLLHGMTGAYDIWWQQIEALQSDYRVIAVTYPAVGTLAEMEAGVLAVLEREGVSQFHVVGSSLGGYFAQYLLTRHPERMLSAVFANTFPPNDLILEKNGTIGSLIPYMPEWLVMNVLKGSFTSSIYPASGEDELTLAFLNELAAGRVRKAQVAGRYQGVVEKFDPPVQPSIPILIIEASNDPLVEAELRQALKAAYPQAQVVTVDNGHFPYLGTPESYTQILLQFWSSR
jgi:maspardin